MFFRQNHCWCFNKCIWFQFHLKEMGRATPSWSCLCQWKSFCCLLRSQKLKKSTMLISNLFKKVRKTKIMLIAESNNRIGLIRNRNAWPESVKYENVINISKQKQRWSQPLLLSFASIRRSPFEFSNAVLFDTKRAYDKWHLKYTLHAICHDYY